MKPVITINNIFPKSLMQYLLLTVLLLIIAVYYNYFDLMCMVPTGTHIWRQTDSASFAWCYWQNGFDFFHPQMMNRTFGDGYAVSEFPIIQYFIAILYAVFGFHWCLSKGVYVLIYLGGIYAIYYITSFFIKDIFWSFYISILFFAAPTLVFYGNSCVPDVAALSFSFIGFAFYLSFKKNYKTYYIWLSSLAFGLAGLLKMSYLIPFVALFFTEAASCLFANNTSTKLVSKKYLLPLLFLFAITIMWLWCVNSYNNINQQSYFLTKINPYWNNTIDDNTKAYIWKRTFTEWKDRLFHMSTHCFFLFSLIMLPVSWRKGNKFLFGIIFFLLIGCAAYYVLWYVQFLVHDYYTIPFYALYFFSILNGCFLLSEMNLNKIKSYFIKVLAILMVLLNMHHTKRDFQVRFNEAAQYNINRVFADDGLRQYIRSIGITSKDYVISIPDDSPQISLYMLGNPGFTEFREGHYDLEKLKAKKQQGAKYLILLDKTSYKEMTTQLSNPIGKYKDVLIYKL